MPTIRHKDAVIHYEEFGQGFPILTFAPAGLQSTIEVWSLLPRCEFIREWKTGPAVQSATTRVKEFLTKHTPGA